MFAGFVVIDVKVISIEGGDVLNRAGGEMPAQPHIVGYQCAGISAKSALGLPIDRLVRQSLRSCSPGRMRRR